MQGGGQNGVAQEEVPVNEPVGNSEQLRSSEIPNNQTVAEGDAPGQSGVDHSLSQEEAQVFITEMEANAEVAPEIELTIENWDSLFGEDGLVETPIGEVKMGENQFTKLMRQGRDGKLGMVKPTLENPDVIIEDESKAKNGETERPSSYVFVKSFKKADGSRYYYFTSVTVSKDGKEVIVSNQEKRRNAIANLLTNGKLVWKHADNVSNASDVANGLYSSQGNSSDLAAEGTDAPQTNVGVNEVYNRHTTAKQPTETVEASQDAEQSGTQATSSMNAPTTSSASEDRNSVSNSQENAQKSGEIAENGGERMYSQEELAETKEQLGELNAMSAPNFAVRLFSIRPWGALEEANAALKELLASYGETLNGQTAAVLPFLDEAQRLISENSKNQELRSVEENLDNGDKKITNYNSRGEVATVAIERDGKVVSVGSYDEGVLFEHTEYDGNGKASLVTRYDKRGNVVGTQVYEDGNAKTPMQKLADRILDRTEEKRRIPLRERARELEAQVGVKANIIESIDEVKNREARERIAAGAAVAGWYSGGQVYLYMPNIKDRREIELTYVHEVVAHHGVKKLLGERFNEFLDGVWNMMSEADRARMLAYVGANENPTLQDMRAAADEYVAELAEKMNLGELEQSTWEKIVDWFKELLENIGFENLTKEDVESMLKASYANLAKGENDAEIKDKTMFRIKEVNDKFNSELESLNEENADKVVLNVGNPSPVLLSAGVEDRPMKLYGNKIIKKAKKHGFKIQDLKNLPSAVADPIAVFDNYQQEGNRSILTELRTADGNILATVDLGKGMDIDFNIISSAFGKSDNKIVSWINKGFATYINKEKALDYLHLSAPIAEASDKQELSSAAKIVESFENPTVESENTLENTQESENGIRFRRPMTKEEARQMVRELVVPFAKELRKEQETRFRKKDSERRQEKRRINDAIDTAAGFITVGGKKQATKNRLKKEAERKQFAKEMYSSVLKGDFNDVTLAQIDKFIEDATPANPFGRRISQRLPQRMERALRQGARTNAVDALFSRICESTVPANERFSEAGRREIEERKKELLKGWAIATGNWHTDLKEFTDDTEPIGEGKDSKVYMSKDGNSVIKASKGKPFGKKFRPDIDNIPLFNDVFKNSRYEILGYGEIDGLFVRILKQDFIDFAESTPLTPEERKEYMGKLGFKPLNKDYTAFSNGEIVIADLQKSNIVKDAAGNISVIDADAKLHTKDVGGNYTYPPVEDDLPEDSGTRFRIANENQDIFVSNAQRAVEGIQQNKATAEQWIAMLKKNGGLKAGEDAWLGLEEWLNEKQGAVTKQEILDYIAQNRIQIEEVEYGANPKSFAALKEEYEDLVRSEGFDAAQEVMIERFGDDFSIAFDYWGGELFIDDEEAASALLSSGNIINSTRLEYTTEGLENKREIALVVPTVESWNKNDEIHFGDAGEGRAVAWVRFGETTADTEETIAAKKAVNDYLAEMREKHNTLEGEETDAMTAEEIERLQELTAKEIESGEKKARVLVIDEIQSKRHQEGREKGYKDAKLAELDRKLNNNTRSTVEELEEAGRLSKERYDYIINKIGGEAVALDNELTELQQKTKELGTGIRNEDAEKQQIVNLELELEGVRNVRDYDRITAEIEEIKERMAQRRTDFDSVSLRMREVNTRIYELINNYVRNQRGAVDAAPFEKNWHELAMKRMLRLAAEEGFDKVAWTTGEQQAQRYDMSKVVSHIACDKVGKNGNKSFSMGLDYKFIVDPNGIVVSSKDEYVGKSLADIVGKPLANKMLEMQEGDTISGDGLRIGGEGMKGFYDKMLPSFVQKYTKKWGAKVGEVTMPSLEENNTMWSVDVTPEMQESVMQGQTMFRMVAYDEAVQEAKTFEETHKGSAPIIVLDGIDNWESEFIKAGVKKDEIERFRERLKTSSGNPKAAYLDDADLIFIFSPKVTRKEFNGYIWHENMHKAIREDDRFNRDIAERIINTVVPGGYQEAIEYFNKHGYEGLAADEEALCQILQVFYINGAVSRKGFKGKGVIQDYFNPLIDKIYGRRDGQNSNLGNRSVQAATHGTDGTKHDGGALATPVEQRAGREGQIQTDERGALEGNAGEEALEMRNSEREEGAAEETRLGVTEQEIARNTATLLGEKLNTPVSVIEDSSTLPENRRDKKGWFDPKTGEVAVVMGNHISTEDVVETVLHEVVGHKGLRAVMGEKFDEFLDGVYRNGSSRVKRGITDVFYGAIKGGHALTVREATEEYIAGLAERDFEGFEDTWNAIKQWFRDFFRNFMNMEVTDGELRYMLWKNYNRMKSGPIETIIDRAMEARTDTGDKGTMFRRASGENISLPNEYFLLY